MTCPSCSVLQAALELEISRRTVGGTPPPFDENWSNRKLDPPSSATTGPTTPAGMRSSLDWARDATAATTSPAPEPGEEKREIQSLEATE